MTRDRRAERGFTLIEISIVIFVIAIVSGITIPYLRDLTGAELGSTTRRLANTSLYLFEEAAFRSTVFALNIDLDGQGWAITRLDPTSGQFVPEESLPARSVTLSPDVRIVDVVLPGLGKVVEGVAPAHFYPEGFADPAVIHLADARNHAYTVRIDPIRGRGEIFDGYRDFEPAS